MDLNAVPKKHWGWSVGRPGGLSTPVLNSIFRWRMLIWVGPQSKSTVAPKSDWFTERKGMIKPAKEAERRSCACERRREGTQGRGQAGFRS